MRCITSTGLALLFLRLAGGAAPQPPLIDAQPEQPFQISVNVDLIVLQSTVRDRKGGFASNLREQDFQVFEDGVPQSVRLFRHEDIPVTVGLVVDHSGSMKNKLSDVVAAARTFVRLSNPQDQMFVVNFNDRVTMGLPEAIPFSDKANELEAAVSKMPAEGETTLYDAISAALDQLKRGDREKKVLIVISDGGDNASKLKLPQVLEKAEESNAMLYTIGIFDHDDPDKNPGVLRRLARETGGEAFFPAEFDEVGAICEGIAADLRHQYAIGYVSTNTGKIGGYRAVRVVARSTGRDLVVRTRTGYVANGGVK
jgi:Ca-activated chloride channel family protein